MKRIVLVNPSAGAIARASDPDAVLQQIQRGFGERNAEVFIDAPPALIERAKRAAQEKADAVIAGGGDGTLNAIANVLADTDTAFGVLPLGTHNHFASDLGVPLDLDEAIAALSQASVEDLPVAQVNGRIFLNFSSLGLHAEIVEHRDAQREQKGRSKWIAMGFAVAHKVINPPLLWVRIATGKQSFTRLTPSVIICNNPYQMKAFGVENASVPDRNLLNLYIAHEHRPLGLAGLMLKAAVGRIEKAQNFEALALEQFAIFSRRGARLSLDGELVDLPAPYHYRIRSRPLKILRPRR